MHMQEEINPSWRLSLGNVRKLLLCGSFVKIEMFLISQFYTKILAEVTQKKTIVWHDCNQTERPAGVALKGESGVSIL